MLGFFITKAINKLLSHLTDIDFSKPIGKCERCGHTTYQMKDDPSVDVCPVCKVMRLMVLLRIPEVHMSNIFERLESKEKIKL